MFSSHLFRRSKASFTNMELLSMLFFVILSIGVIFYLPTYRPSRKILTRGYYVESLILASDYDFIETNPSDIISLEKLVDKKTPTIYYSQAQQGIEKWTTMASYFHPASDYPNFLTEKMKDLFTINELVGNLVVYDRVAKYSYKVEDGFIPWLFMLVLILVGACAKKSRDIIQADTKKNAIKQLFLAGCSCNTYILSTVGYFIILPVLALLPLIIGIAVVISFKIALIALLSVLHTSILYHCLGIILPQKWNEVVPNTIFSFIIVIKYITGLLSLFQFKFQLINLDGISAYAWISALHQSQAGGTIEFFGRTPEGYSYSYLFYLGVMQTAAYILLTGYSFHLQFAPANRPRNIFSFLYYALLHRFLFKLRRKQRVSELNEALLGSNFEPYHNRQAETANQKKYVEEGKIVDVRNINKKYESNGNIVNALNNFSMRLYQSELYILLGHNGAGKTTAMNCLIGSELNDDGTVSILDYSLPTEAENMRRNVLGYCLQESLIIPKFTVLQQLMLISEIKNDKKSSSVRLSSYDIIDELENLLKLVDLETKKDNLVETLSGGELRRLSLAQAFCCDPKFVILDEPTSGIDSSMRSELWKILKQLKENKIVLMTTHYLDEAEAIGDRIGIMSGGTMHLEGSMSFLKENSKAGYRLVIICQGDTRTALQSKKQMVMQQIQTLSPTSRIISDVANDIVVQIPLDIKDEELLILLKDLEAHKSNNLVVSYELFSASLEDIFVDILEDISKTEESKKDPNIVNGANSDFVDAIGNLKSNNIDASRTLQFSTTKLSGISLLLSRVRAFFSYLGIISWRRLLIPILLLFVIGIPLTVNFFSLAKISWHYFRTPSILSSNTPPRCFTDKALRETRICHDSRSSGRAESYAKILKESGFGATLIEHVDPYYTTCLDKEPGIHNYPTLVMKYDREYTVHRIGLIAPLNCSKDFGVFELHDAIARMMNKNDQKLNVEIHYFQDWLRYYKHDIADIYKKYSYVYFFLQLVVGYLVLGALHSALGSYKKESFPVLLKSMGVAPIVGRFLTCILVVILTAVIAAAFTGWGMVFTNISYPVEHIFVLANAIFFTYIYLSLFGFGILSLGGLAAILMPLGTQVRFDPNESFFMALLTWLTASREQYLGWFILTPTPGLAVAHWMNKKATDESEHTLLIIVLLIRGFIYIVAYIVLDIIRNINFEALINFVGYQKVAENDGRGDSDVWQNTALAKNNINTGAAGQMIQISELVVAYTKKSAFFKVSLMDCDVVVKRVSMSVAHGEILCLVGESGAGKSSLLNTLTGITKPSYGKVRLDGVDPNTFFYEYQSYMNPSNVGICYQKDMLNPELTVMEHLEIVCRAKGISSSAMPQVISSGMRLCGLSNQSTQRAGVLSGGNKRRLCTLLSLVGNPNILLLDEPTCGMDPIGRRSLWSAIQDIASTQTSDGKYPTVVMTTHLMSEAEALSTKVAIFAEGSLRSYASCSRLKDLYGNTYCLATHLREANEERVALLLENTAQLTSNTSVGTAELSSTLFNAWCHFSNLPDDERAKRESKLFNPIPVPINATPLEKLARFGIEGTQIWEALHREPNQVSLTSLAQWWVQQDTYLYLTYTIHSVFPMAQLLSFNNGCYVFSIPRDISTFNFATTYERFISIKNDLFRCSTSSQLRNTSLADIVQYLQQ